MRMARRTWLSLGLAVGLTACFGGGGPEGAVRDFYAAVADGNAEKAMEFIALQQVSANEMLVAKGKIQMLVGQGKAKIEANNGLAKVEVLEQNLSEDGNMAKLNVQLTYKNGKTTSERMRLRKEDGRWKISL